MRAGNQPKFNYSIPLTPKQVLQRWSLSSTWFWAFVFCASLILAQTGPAATPAPVRPAQPGVTTNRVQLPARPGRTNPAPMVAPRPGSTATNTAAGTNLTSKLDGLVQKAREFQKSNLFLPAVIGLAVCLLALLLVRVKRSSKKTDTSPTVTKVPRISTGKAASVHSCIVYQTGPEAHQIWQFDVRGRRSSLTRDYTLTNKEPLPAVARKNWRALFQRKLNVAWLPPEQVFLRAVQLPRSDFADTISMVELQLEKLSPMPVAQVVWSVHILPHAEGDLQTVVVTIVSRNVVEEFLGKLEGQGYLADRLELPLVDQLQTTAITEDGAWVYPEVGGSKNTALVAWWYGGVLQNLDLLALTSGDHAGSLKEQLMQMAWAGEMEGWLTAPPAWHLVADATVAAQWEPTLRQALDQPVDVLTPLESHELAALTARRAASSDVRSSLLPPEYGVRYQQQFVDRLWMRGLLAVAGLYIIGVAIYMVALTYSNYQTGTVEAQVKQLSPVYTNVMQLKARFQVLKDRQELKYAALDCWNATARHLPESATLDSINFSQGKRLTLNGTAPSDSIRELYDFESAMRKTVSNGQPLFDQTKGETVNWRVQGPIANWSLALELKRSEVP